VKTDDNGTYVIVANPKMRLTAHDNKGNLLFDGEIETAEQQKKVPKEVWAEVKPMLKQMQNPQAEKDADDK
jgi:Ethanolamine utilization protein EutJ (predicted chaperonin)